MNGFQEVISPVDGLPSDSPPQTTRRRAGSAKISCFTCRTPRHRQWRTVLLDTAVLGGETSVPNSCVCLGWPIAPVRPHNEEPLAQFFARRGIKNLRMSAMGITWF